MNGRTARLLRKFKLIQAPSITDREAYRAWYAVPVPERAALRKDMQNAVKK